MIRIVVGKKYVWWIDVAINNGPKPVVDGWGHYPRTEMAYHRGMIYVAA